MVSIIWGIRFSLKANPNGSNKKSFDTVLPRRDGVVHSITAPLVRDLAIDAVSALGSLAGEECFRVECGVVKLVELLKRHERKTLEYKRDLSSPDSILNAWLRSRTLAAVSSSSVSKT